MHTDTGPDFYKPVGHLTIQLFPALPAAPQHTVTHQTHTHNLYDVEGLLTTLIRLRQTQFPACKLHGACCAIQWTTEPPKQQMIYQGKHAIWQALRHATTLLFEAVDTERISTRNQRVDQTQQTLLNNASTHAQLRHSAPPFWAAPNPECLS